jgi:hypothetical protein
MAYLLINTYRMVMAMAMAMIVTHNNIAAE